MNSIFFTLIKKEIFQEIKTKDTLLSMVIFGISTLLFFVFAFNPNSTAIEKFLPGLIWMTLIYSLNIGITRNFAKEKEFYAINLLLMSPIDRGYIFLSKVVSFILYLFISQVILIPLFHLFLGFPLISDYKFWILIILVNWSISSLGVLVAGLGFRSKMGDVLNILLFFPLSTPVLISTVKVTTILSKGLKFSSYSFWVMIIFSSAVLLTILGVYLFDYSMEE